MCKSFWKRGRNEGPEAPPDMELGDPHAMGAGGHRDFVCDWFLRTLRGESDPAAVDRAPFGKGDRRAGGTTGHFDPVALDASHTERLGDSRAGAGWDTAFAFGGRGARPTPDRFLLGPKGIAERAPG